MYCEEKNRSWCSSSNTNDQRAVTIECASDTSAPYAFKTVVYNKLIDLCVDICKRNGKKKLIWLGDKNKTLNYNRKQMKWCSPYTAGSLIRAVPVIGCTTAWETSLRPSQSV